MDLNSVKFDLASMIAETANTNDLAKLDQQLTQRVFVACSLKEREQEHEKLKYQKYLGFAYTFRKFVGYKYKEDVAPFFLSGTDYLFFGAETAPISGELYEVPSSHIIDLDNLRSNGVKYQRILVELLLPYRYVFKNVKDRAAYGNLIFPSTETGGTLTTHWQIKKVWAWMYVGKRDYWHKRMDADISFSPINRMRPNSGWTPSYYFFSHNERIRTNIK